jgi:hypothetical protein
LPLFGERAALLFLLFEKRRAIGWLRGCAAGKAHETYEQTQPDECHGHGRHAAARL